MDAVAKLDPAAQAVDPVMAIPGLRAVKGIHLGPPHKKPRDPPEMIVLRAHIAGTLAQKLLHHGLRQTIRLVDKDLRVQHGLRRQLERHIRRGGLQVKALLRQRLNIPDLHGVQINIPNQRVMQVRIVVDGIRIHQPHPVPRDPLHRHGRHVGGRHKQYRPGGGHILRIIDHLERLPAGQGRILKRNRRAAEMHRLRNIEQQADGRALRTAVQPQVQRVAGVRQRREQRQAAPRHQIRRQVHNPRAADRLQKLRIGKPFPVPVRKRHALYHRHIVQAGLQIAVIGLRDPQPNAPPLVAPHCRGLPVLRDLKRNLRFARILPIKQGDDLLAAGQALPADPVKVIHRDGLHAAPGRLILDGARLALDDPEILHLLLGRQRNQLFLQRQLEPDRLLRARLREMAIHADIELRKQAGRLPEREAPFRRKLLIAAAQEVRHSVIARRRQRQSRQHHRRDRLPDGLCADKVVRILPDREGRRIPIQTQNKLPAARLHPVERQRAVPGIQRPRKHTGIRQQGCRDRSSLPFRMQEKLHTLAGAQNRPVIQQHRAALHAVPAEIKQGDPRLLLFGRDLLYSLRAARQDRNGRRAAADRDDLPKMPGNRENIRQARAGDIDIPRRFKQDRLAVLAGLALQAAALGQLYARHGVRHEVDHRDATRRGRREQRDPQHIDKLRAVLIHHLVERTHGIRHLIRKNQPDHRADIRILRIKLPFRRIGGGQTAHLRYQIPAGTRIYDKLMILRHRSPPLPDSDKTGTPDYPAYSSP